MSEGDNGMKRIGLLAIVMLFVLTACSTNNNSDSQASNEELDFLDVQLTITPEKAQVNEPIQFQAKVMFGSKPVKKAEEVTFEIWRSQSENHEKVVVNHVKDGNYELTKAFAEEGTYYIYAHVTAEGMHSMPKKEFVVGKPSAAEE